MSNNSVPAPVRETFERQARYCAGPGLSPFTGEAVRTILDLVDQRSAFGRAIIGWQGDPSADALALRAVAGFHALKRRGHAGLIVVYPPNRVEPARMRTTFAQTIEAEDGFLAQWLERPPQTNEPNRSGMILGALLSVAEAAKLPLRLYEIGASGGLNLNAAHYRYDLGQGGHWGHRESAVHIGSNWRGNAPKSSTELHVESATGCDLNPLDVKVERERLMAYVWPDQPDRLARMEAAIAFAQQHPPNVKRADAAQWVEAEIEPRRGSATLLYHTIVWQYLPQTTKARIQSHMARAGERAGADAPLFWFRCEADETGEPGAALSMARWPGGETHAMGRADFHGRWVDWA